MATIVRKINIEPGRRSRSKKVTLLDRDGNETEFILTWRYNSRRDGWYLDIRDAAENPVILGVRCTVNYPLVSRYRGFAQGQQVPLPGGMLFVFHKGNPNQDPRVEELGEAAVMYHAADTDNP